MTPNHHIEEDVINVLGINKQSDVARFIMHLRENPTLYAAGVLLAVLAVFAGLVWRGAAESKEKQVMTDYAAALVDTEDEAIRATKLEQLAESVSGPWGAEIVYMSGEAALSQGANDKAEAAFNRVLAEFPGSEYASRATEGLAFIKEAKGDHAGAAAAYAEVATKYAGSFTAKLQPNNIGRVKEASGDFAGAVEAYKQQLTVFPDSQAAIRAQEALDRLKAAHPALFPAEVPAPDAAIAPAAEAAPAVEAAPAAEAAPAPEAAVAPAPETAPAPAAEPVPAAQ